jgi:hypothetical protein
MSHQDTFLPLSVEAITCGTPSRGIYTSEATRHPYVRVRGDAATARLEVAPWHAFDVPVEEWGWAPLAGSVTITPEGEVAITCETMDAAGLATLAADYRRALRDVGLVVLERGRRYLTSWYACLDRREAERLAAINGSEIQVADAEIVHATGEWALWSDGRITTAIGLPRWATRVRTLAPAAERLISTCRGSDSGAPQIAGGYLALAAVVEVIEEQPIDVGESRGVYARDTTRRLRLRLRDGSERTIYERSAGYFEGYAYELADDVAQLRDAVEVLG